MVIVIPLVALFLLVSAVVAVKTFFLTTKAEETMLLPALQTASKKVTQGFGSASGKTGDSAVSNLEKDLDQTSTNAATSDLDALDKQAAGL